MSEQKLIEMAFDWAGIPKDLPKQFLVKIIAKTPATTYHKIDKPYIRIYTKDELREAARSLAHTHIDLNHDLTKKIPGAFVVDAQYNEGRVEAICYIPDLRVIEELKRGEITNVSVEEDVRELIETKEGTELHGIIFTGLALMENSFLQTFRGHAGDKNTKIELIEANISGMFEMCEAEATFPESCKECELSEFTTYLGEPFAGYKDFAACVAANQDKGNPEAYCGYIKHKVEDQPKKEVTEAEKVKGYEPPESGDLPDSGKDILASAYASCRKDNPDYDKERCSKIAWGAVKNAGYEQDEKGSWKMKEVSLGPADPTKPENCSLEPKVEPEPLKEVQLPEKPVNTLAHPQDPVLNLAPQDPLKPETNVAAAGVIHDKGFGASGAGTPDTKGNPMENLGTPIVTAPTVDAGNPKKVDQIDVNTKPVEIDEEKVNKMVEAVVEKEDDKKKIEEDKKRIKELEEAVTRLQTSNAEIESKFSKSVTEARKQGREETINKFKAVVESERFMNSRYNFTAKTMLDKIKKVINESEGN